MSYKDLKYKNKYLKYKNKYLNLKNQTGSGIFTKFFPPSLVNLFIKDTTLDYDRIDDTELLQIAELMKINKTVTTLNITNSSISDKGFKTLCDALKTNTTLTTLNLSNNKITDTQFIILIKGLQKNTTLEILNLSGNILNDNDVYLKLGEFLKQNKTLTTLNLSNNNITVEQFIILIKGLQKNTTLEILNLSGNILNDNVIKEIENLLEINRTLTNIIMDEENLNTMAVEIINKGKLEEISTFLNTKKLKKLYINKTISYIGFENLCTALITNKILETLHISNNNNLDDIDLMVLNLCIALKENKKLTTLHLNINELNDYNAERITKLLGREVNLSSHPVVSL